MKNSFLLYSFILYISFGCTNKITNNTVRPNNLVEFKMSSDLKADFLNPPDYAKPRVYWWWLEGNISKEGILKDLTDMKKAGIKGAIVFDAGSSSYQAMEHTDAGFAFMSDEWRKLFTYACQVANDLDMEISLNITSGWNDGGPWVTPAYSSKKLVWSEKIIQGPFLLNDTLSMPSGLLIDEKTHQSYYKPIAVLAVRLNEKSGNIAPLENLDIKAVHSIFSIPKIKDLGFNWDIFMKEEQSPIDEYHARLNQVIDISNKINDQGHIEWKVPKGNYLIMRFGYTGTGIKVSTHSPKSGGLAIDYMSSEATDLLYGNVVNPLLKEIEAAGGKKSLKFLHDDSWELGASNWTPDFISFFKKQNGYDILNYLPILSGRIIESKDVSNRFLYDFRRTIADLIWQNHYKRFQELAHQSGLGIHPESGGPHPAPMDALKNLGLNDVPMGEFWIRSKTHRIKPEDRFYIKQASSAGHIYGKRFIQAEGPTSVGPHWEEDFAYMKPTFDRVYCAGLNRWVVHTFTHSPIKAGIPGNEYFAGTHFNQNVTWWKQAPAFFSWNARNSFMLSQGLFVGDVCFYYGDNVPNQVPLKHIIDGLGEGYDYDVCNTDVLLTRMSTKDGKLYLPDGLSYEVLVLPDRKGITPEVLAKIRELVKNGATIIGPKPTTFVGLRNNKKAKHTIQQLAEIIWGNVDGKSVFENQYGKGKVVWGKTIREVLLNKRTLPDFEYSSRKANAYIDYIHRTTNDAEIYYVANRNEQPEYLISTFRVKDKIPELWYPETGETIDLKLYKTIDGRTTLPLFLEPFGSVFVVFRNPEDKKHYTALSKGEEELFPSLPKDTFTLAPFITDKNSHIFFTEQGNYTLTKSDQSTEIRTIAPPSVLSSLNSGWNIGFDKNYGAPENIQLSQLFSWIESTNPHIKYYSGTAVYENHFLINNKLLEGKHIYLDLGQLYNIAEVWINNKNAGVWWQPPFRKDISNYIVSGENRLVIKVVNLWPNRIIGDQLLPDNKRYTKTNVRKFTKDYPLRPSGLIGPVTVIEYE